jgi:hypothetical protein
VLVRPANSSAAGLLPRAGPRATPQRQPLGSTGIAQSASGNSLEYRGRPLQLTKSRRFAWDYDVPSTRPAAGPLRAELWTTQDGGVTWQRSSVDNDGHSPIDVTLPASGLYGVRLEMVSDAADDGGGPRSGAAPDAWVGVDEEPPQVELVAISRDEATPSGALVIRYVVRDPLIAPRAVRLLYSPNADGPWATITDGIDNQGEHRWTPDKTVPAKVHIRAEASDLAGNVGAATFPDEIRRVRAIVGDLPLLVPGIGAQGGDVEATVQAGKTANGTGLMINSSRAILYAGKGEDFAAQARRVAQATRDEINRYR